MKTTNLGLLRETSVAILKTVCSQPQRVRSGLFCFAVGCRVGEDGRLGGRVELTRLGPLPQILSGTTNRIMNLARCLFSLYVLL